MHKVKNFTNDTFRKTKYSEILEKPIMSTDNFNLLEDNEWRKK